MSKIFYISALFILSALSTQCMHNQPGDFAFGYQGTLCTLVNVYVCLLCQHLYICMCMCACVCVRAGHPETARPDVQESGLCGVMSGSLADSADLEQCTQVSPANELSI